jgi:hypothetical protein
MSRRRPPRELPPRGEALHGLAFLLTFDVDCGEQLPGHVFVARGLSDDGVGSGPEQGEPGTRLFSLEYELVPGVAPQRHDDLFRFLVHIEYTADVELPWDPTDGGAIAPFEGGSSTHGSRGSWPLPADAKQLNFFLYPVPPGQLWPADESSGRLAVDLTQRSAQWIPN